MLLCTKIRLEVSEQGAATLECMQGKCSGHKQAMPLWKRTYHCPNRECRLSLDRDENSAVNILKRYLARRGPHTGDPVRCADVFTAIEDVNTFEHV